MYCYISTWLHGHALVMVYYNLLKITSKSDPIVPKKVWLMPIYVVQQISVLFRLKIKQLYTIKDLL